MRPSKCSVVTNQPDNQFLKDANITLDNQEISILKNTDTVRILGVFWTLNNNHGTTFAHAYTQAKNLVGILRRKILPGKVCIHLINTIIIPIVLYRLQLTPTSPSQIKKINQLFLSIVKKKFNLPMNTPNEVIYCKDTGLGLHELQLALDKQWLGNFQTHIQPDDLTAQVIAAHTTQVQKRRRILHNLLEMPIKLYKNFSRRQPFILHIATRLQNYHIRFLSSPNMDRDNIRQVIPLDKAQPIWKQLQLSKINNVSALRTMNNTVKSYKTWSESIGATAIRNRFINREELPPFYKTIIETLSGIENQDFTMDEEYPINLTPNPFPQHRPIVPYSAQTSHIYTDGSLKNNVMGSSAIFTDNVTETHAIRGKPSPSNASSTRAELFAIFIALAASHPNQNLILYTDSQSAIKAITSFGKPLTGIRKQLKLSNYSILNSIHALIKDKGDASLVFQWIKGHSGIEFNERADVEANLARRHEPETILNRPHNSIITQYAFQNQVLLDQFIPSALQSAGDIRKYC
jgi:ribonuclease HI